MSESAGRVRRVVVAWATGLATTLVIAIAAIICAQGAIIGAQAIHLDQDAEHAGWLALFAGVPLAAVAGGYRAGRMAGPQPPPAAAWLLLNPAMVVCGSIIGLQAAQDGWASEYFVELLGPSSVVVALSFGGALWGRRRWIAAAEQ